ncbi:hypothetical protein R3W88_029479 [Solanum pinnatisectum]|uniref:Uncharacterized protein n=1 Tax=Solanum pinnatisectum TaxID=50273 RepID=A0AAV9K5G0_9SOLN|nr:hypothetical protein R3W88_029479 [Solanum pinnatisectum]
MDRNCSENGKSIKVFGFEITTTTTTTTTTTSAATIMSEKDFMGRKIKKGNRWTENEHKDFLPNRTLTQVASHAQKYFVRLWDVNSNSNERKKRKKSSIFDLRIEKTEHLEKKQRIHIKLLFHWEIIKKVSKKLIMCQVLFQIT